MGKAKVKRGRHRLRLVRSAPPPCADCPAPAVQPAAHPTYCGRCWQRRRRKGLLPPGAVDNERRHAYYCALQEDPDFAAAFKALYVRLFPALARRFAGPLEWDAAIREADRRGMTPEDAAAVADFRKAWPLTQRAEVEQEIWASFYAANCGGPLRLRARWDGHLSPPAPLALDPLLHSATEATAELKRRRRLALDAGWKGLPPWYRDWRQLRLTARWVVLAAVKGLSWSEIARLERAKRGLGGITPTSIRNRVVPLATALGITLPGLQKGRPPKH